MLLITKDMNHHTLRKEIIHSIFEYSITDQQRCKLYNNVEGLDIIDKANHNIHLLCTKFLNQN